MGFPWLVVCYWITTLKKYTLIRIYYILIFSYWSCIASKCKFDKILNFCYLGHALILSIYNAQQSFSTVKHKKVTKLQFNFVICYCHRQKFSILFSCIGKRASTENTIQDSRSDSQHILCCISYSVCDSHCTRSTFGSYSYDCFASKLIDTYALHFSQHTEVAASGHNSFRFVVTRVLVCLESWIREYFFYCIPKATSNFNKLPSYLSACY